MADPITMRAQTGPGDELGWLVDLACDGRLANVCPKAIARAKTRLLDLRRERDEARAALDMAYPRALQAAASILDHLPSESAWLDEHFRDLAAQMRALTPDDIDRLTKEHEHG